MSTEIKTYRHSPNVSTDPNGTLVDTETDADDGAFSVTVPTAGWDAGTYEVTVTAQKTGELVSAHSNAVGLTVNGSSAIALDNGGAPWSAAVQNAAGSTISRTFTVGGDVRTLVCVVSFYTTANDPYPVSVAWQGGTPAGATDWVCRAWPVGTTGNTTTSFTGTQSSGSDLHDGTIHWTTQIWTATWNGTPASATVVATRTGSDAFTGILSVYSFANASATLGGAAQHHTPMSEVGGSNQLMQLTITPGYTGSWIVGIVHWGNATAAMTEMSGTTEDYSNGDAGEQGWGMAFHATDPTVASTPVTVGVTNSQYAWAMCAIEVRKA